MSTQGSREPLVGLTTVTELRILEQRVTPESGRRTIFTSESGVGLNDVVSDVKLS